MLYVKKMHLYEMFLSVENEDGTSIEIYLRW